MRAGTMPPIVVDELTALAELDALRPEWTRLWAAADATPFQSPAWLIPWWRHFGRGTPMVLTLRRERSLVGVVPMYTWDGDGDARLVLIGTGNTDHLDALFLPGMESAAAMAAVAHLAARGGAWSGWDFQQLPPASPLLRAPVPERVRSEVREQEPCPVMPVPAPSETLSARLPRGLRRRLAYARNRAGRMGDVRFVMADEENLSELLEALFRLHEARWADRGAAGVLADETVRAFHAEAALELLRLGALRLYALRIDGRIIGVHYGFADRRRAYYYIGGFAPEYGMVSPGVLLVAHALEQAARDGVREFDFLRGRERYKYEWGATDRPSYRRVLRAGAGPAAA
ncbi:MAG TPA: GNAT family N-acetyltransferase [Gemmatimonadaceae bacterium]